MKTRTVYLIELAIMVFNIVFAIIEFPKMTLNILVIAMTAYFVGKISGDMFYIPLFKRLSSVASHKIHK